MLTSFLDLKCCKSSKFPWHISKKQISVMGCVPFCQPVRFISAFTVSLHLFPKNISIPSRLLPRIYHASSLQEEQQVRYAFCIQKHKNNSVLTHINLCLAGGVYMQISTACAHRSSVKCFLYSAQLGLPLPLCFSFSHPFCSPDDCLNLRRKQTVLRKTAFPSPFCISFNCL